MPRRPAQPFEDYDRWYEPSRPRPVKDGIKARNQRGALAANWWAKRWIAVLDTFGWGSRLGRGRSYARQGQVRSIDVATGQVAARVQGSRPAPYKVSIRLTPLSDAQWSAVIGELAQQVIFAAQLLAGEMPQQIEEAFAAAGVALFPQGPADLVTDCSCPDIANPCKHIAAVYYLLGERFDDDPFLLFVLRGRTRDAIVDALRARRSAVVGPADTARRAPAEVVPALAEQLDSFYSAGAELETLSIHLAPPDTSAALVPHLADAPAGTAPDLQRIYGAMTGHALDRVFGTDEAERERG